MPGRVLLAGLIRWGHQMGLWQAADLGLSAPGRSGLARDGEEDVALNLISNHKKENQGAKGRKTPGCKFSWISSIYPCQESGSNGVKKGFEAFFDRGWRLIWMFPLLTHNKNPFCPHHHLWGGWVCFAHMEPFTAAAANYRFKAWNSAVDEPQAIHIKINVHIYSNNHNVNFTTTHYLLSEKIWIIFFFCFEFHNPPLKMDQTYSWQVTKKGKKMSISCELAKLKSRKRFSTGHISGRLPIHDKSRGCGTNPKHKKCICFSFFWTFPLFLPFLSQAQRCLHQAARGEGDSDTCYNANKNSKFVCVFFNIICCVGFCYCFWGLL